MYDFFIRLLNMSFAASVVALAVVFLRVALKKAPRKIICVMWALVALRLILPFSIPSNLSAFNLLPASSGNRGQVEYFRYNGHPEKPMVEFDIPVLAEDNGAPNSASIGRHTSDLYLPAVVNIWVAGVCAMMIYMAASYIQLRKKVAASIPLHGRLMITDAISSPFILGVVKPVIYIPSGMDEKTLAYVVAHEEAHIMRRDHWWKPLGYLLLMIYWFNPVLWLAYILLCKDIELACDEKVVQEMDKDGKAEYSQALLDCGFPRRRIAACPLAFGEVSVKERVKSVLQYKKPAFWIIVVAVAVCIMAAVCFMTNPVSKTLPEKLGISMDMAVAAHNRSAHSGGNFAAVDYKVLRISETPTTATVYAWVMYEEFSFDGKELHLEQGSHIPSVITFDTSKNSGASSYAVIEYWQPGDGANYAGDIRSKFPMTLWASAFDVSCAIEQKANCLKSAQAYYGITDTAIAEVTKWFDCLNGDVMVWDGIREIQLDEFPDVTFRWLAEKMAAVTDKQIVPLYTGMPIWSSYFCDLNGDGKREICSTISIGSGIVDNRVVIYDYARNKSYELADRGEYDYTLNMYNGRLAVEKRAYMQEELLSLGTLVFRNNAYEIGSEQLIFRGTVREIKERTLLVQGKNETDLYSVPIANMAASPEPAVGDVVEIVYTGGIEEIYPMRFSEIISVAVIR